MENVTMISRATKTGMNIFANQCKSYTLLCFNVSNDTNLIYYYLNNILVVPCIFFKMKHIVFVLGNIQ